MMDSSPRKKDPQLWHVDALMTTTKKTLPMYKEVVDLYVDLGIRNIHLRPSIHLASHSLRGRPLGTPGTSTWRSTRQRLDYILELNRQGVQIIEGTASTFLQKMLTPEDPNFVTFALQSARAQVRSPTDMMAPYIHRTRDAWSLQWKTISSKASAMWTR